MKLTDEALKARKNGVSTVPVTLPSKKPPKGVEWKWRQTALPDESTIRRDLSGGNGNLGFALIGGKVSGNLEILDFDLEGEFYHPWVSLVEAEAPGLINQLSIQQTRSGGFHVISKCQQPVPGSTKLARKSIEVSGPGEHKHHGKKFEAQQRNGKWYIYPEAIETKGEGGYAVVSPSPGYLVIQPGESGDFYNFPEITAKEREVLIRSAKALDECPPEPAKGTIQQAGGRPGDDFNTRGEVLPLLLADGWKEAGQSGNKLHITRPGKKCGVSASLYNSNVLHVFSSNALPFEADKSYDPFAIYTFLKHNGDFSAAAKDLASQGYGDGREQTTDKPQAEPKQSPCFVTMSELCAKKFNPIQWLLPDIFPIGSMLLAGPPKLGKSVFALNLAVAVATDGDVYGGYSCGSGDVIYLALEDNERRLQARIQANLNGRRPTDRMQLYHLGSEWPCLGDGCITELRRKIDACTNPKLLIVDTLARVRPRKERRKAQYDLDYSDLSRFHVLTSQYTGLTIFIISHTRKAAADDVFDTISGTQGLSGAVDTLAVMAGFRGKGDAKLIVAGRDVMDVNKALVYEKSTWSWKIAGDAIEIENSEFQDAIFQILKKFDDDKGLSLVDIVELSAGQLKKPTVKYNVSEWFKTGIVDRINRGRYRLCEGARKADSLEGVFLSPIPEYYND